MGINPTGWSWTGERVSKLRRLWDDGLSCSHIAAEIGGCTRNAVIGKVTRLGLSARHSRAEQTRKLAPRPRPRKLRVSAAGGGGRRVVFVSQVEPPVRHLPPEEIPIDQRKQLLQLREQHCRWPYGNPGKPGFFFCGGDALPCFPYCAAHMRAAYQCKRAA